MIVKFPIRSIGLTEDKKMASPLYADNSCCSNTACRLYRLPDFPANWPITPFHRACAGIVGFAAGCAQVYNSTIAKQLLTTLLLIGLALLPTWHGGEKGNAAVLAQGTEAPVVPPIMQLVGQVIDVNDPANPQFVGLHRPTVWHWRSLGRTVIPEEQLSVPGVMP